jgi:trk system potassium uptake protein TrkA
MLQAVQAGDRIHVTAPSAQLVALLGSVGLRQQRARHAMIIGGSRIAIYLAEFLLRSGTNVKIIELDAAKAAELASKLPQATVINADGTNQNILQSENVSQMDTVVAVTNMDEENLIISMYAKHVGVPQVITKINRTEYTDLFREKGIDCIISPKHLCAQEIVRYVRSMQNTSGGVLSVHHLLDSKVEAIELKVTESTKNHGVPLKDLHLKPNILLACINRMDQVIIPGGLDAMLPGDTVVVVSLAGRIIVDLNDIFQES